MTATDISDADDFSHMLTRAVNAEVEKIIVTGGSASESRDALDIVQGFDNLFSTVGCHPTRCQEFEADKDGPEHYYQNLLDIAADAKEKVVAIGECGLDYDRLHFCPKDVQLRYFEKQFDLAEQTGLPMFLHCRNTGVLHSFTDSIDVMERAVAMGLYIGINGCSLKTQDNLDVVKRIPEDRLMIETDAPWCDMRPTHASYSHLKSIPKTVLDLYAPPSRKKERFEEGLMVKGRNEPCCVGQVLHALASIRGVDAQYLADKIYENTVRVFFTQ
ncbi:9564_t:CDS:2 [Paraglomus brasilianum]|uniref:9564_t:CDS:1 n=1 Tax=Paraglomus brasilianum TaxID=144538 RepID=A0A9N9AUY5_9GLOM|nr:9564_t:CDS:2 [Paraglomus brasilianum]